MSAEGDVKKLSDLRVVDLRTELEKRGLDKSGVKQTLIDRLQKALVDDGLNPEMHNFELDKKPMRLSTSSRETEENVSEEQNMSTDKNEPKIEVKIGTSEKNNNSDTIKETVKSTETVKEQKTMEENDNITPINISKKVEIIKSDESPITLTVEEEELETSEIEKSTIVQKQSDEKKNDNNNTVGEEPAKEVDLSNNQQDAVKSEEMPTNGGSSVGKETSGKPIASDGQNRNLWITNISQTTRATELKQALSEHGKVIGAKVVINARYPGACCYGYVKMETVADADNCIAKLNGTELNGQIIRIEKVRPDHLNPLKNAVRKPEPSDKSPTKGSGKSNDKKEIKSDKPKEKKDSEEKDKDDKKTDKYDRGSKSENESKEKRSDSDRNSQKRSRRSRERIRRRSSSRDRNDRNMSSRSHRRELLTFDKIKDERERERYRERERMIREEKRRREAAERQREIDRTQRSLEREREKLRIERERLERERAEIMQLERERQKLEREKLELEKIELERVKLRIQEEERRSAKRPSSYRREDFEEKRRAAPDRHYADAPPPPRFETGTSVKPREPSPKKFASSSGGNKDYKPRVTYEKRDSYLPKRDRNYEPERSQSSISRSSSNINVFNIDRARDVRDPRPRNTSSSLSNNNVQKVSNYSDSRERDRERSPHFRITRDERRPTSEHKTDIRSSRDHRYNESSKDRSFERSNSNAWGHPSVSGKVFNTASVPPKVWAKDSWRSQESSTSSDRWNSASSSRCGNAMSGAPFSNNSGLNLGPAPCPPPCPPPPGISNYVNDRFDYKNMRKY